jgi:hypothetical protein
VTAELDLLRDANTWENSREKIAIFCVIISERPGEKKIVIMKHEYLKKISIFQVNRLFAVSWGSSGSIVSSYGLDNRATEVRSQAEAKGIFSAASVSRPALGPTQPPVQWVPGVLSPRLKRGQGVTLTTHPHLVPRS